ncbi:MAG: YraN family protein [Tissierellia bacterium]|nr:YraN family protein [Tissierellia bacterium]
MKKSKKLVGMMGEEIACKFLKSKGYLILERNFSCKHGELDIIAYKSQELVIVEVKTRKNDSYLYACQAVTDKKVKNIKMATHEFLSLNSYYDLNYRFDIIECYWQTRKIRHIIDAF